MLACRCAHLREMTVSESFEPERLSEAECEQVFRRLFPLGFGGDDVFGELAPQGWERSPWLSAFHPKPEQVHREALRVHRNLRDLTCARDSRQDDREPTLADIRATWRELPVDRDREPRELVGHCVWDVFSDNHEVITPDSRIVDIGSFRGAAGFIADLLNREIGQRRYDYLDFYLGSLWISDRADLTPAYALLFRRLARQGFDWKYAFPRLYAIDFGGDPGETFTRQRERDELHTLLEESHREAIERAQDQPPPCTVDAYRQVYGRDPRGWPPWG